MGRRNQTRQLRGKACMAAILATSALALGGCKTIPWILPPHPAGNIVADLTQTQADEKALFTKLQQPSPACDASSVAPLFATVKADLEKARTDNTPQNPSIDLRITKLEANFDQIQAALPAAPACLPANAVTAQQPNIEMALSKMITDETPAAS